MSQAITRIAMWSGPRNISTAMMRSWENRKDTTVVDEPFYACYLNHSGVIHPMNDEILASQPNDWNAVIESLQTPLADTHRIQYQKHMTHHMLIDVDHDWFASLTHAFLIRHPDEVVFSYAQKRDEVTAADLGFKRQRELFERALALGITPPVIESKDILKDPQGKLTALCKVLGVPFDSAMLHWPKGGRESDGVWSAHWYQNVENSTEFAPYVEKKMRLTCAQNYIVEECLEDYLALAQYKL